MEITSKTPVLIVGTGPEARVVLDIANALDVMVYGFITDKEEETNLEINDLLILGQLGDKDVETLLQDEYTRIVIAVKEHDKRMEWVADLSSKSAEIISFVHPSAIISPYARIGDGVVVYPGVTILSNSLIGAHSLIMSGTNIGADVEIGEYVTIEQGVQIGAGVVIDTECFVGAGAVVQPEVGIGRESLIGAGSVVLTDIPENATAFGNPARVVE
ncbi:MAG: NeuD/PglB/VioB family sugar acetyltransferase [Bacteroidia bacterium]|nr:NeuD/PglB/VioB family sugar acetyltransferase [Bacteroidia bacterium]